MTAKKINCECGGEIQPLKKDTFPVYLAQCLKCGKDWGIWDEVPIWDYISTYSGHKINIPEFNIDKIPLRDIAHQLSLIPRFSGCVRLPYSVGQHSLMVAEKINPIYMLRGLTHDCTDMIFGDMASPLKHHPIMKSFYTLEKEVQDKFYKSFNLSLAKDMTTFERQELKKWDMACQCAEARDLTCLTWWAHIPERHLIPEKIVPMPPDEVEHRYLQQLRHALKAHGVSRD